MRDKGGLHHRRCVFSMWKWNVNFNKFAQTSSNNNTTTNISNEGKKKQQHTGSFNSIQYVNDTPFILSKILNHCISYRFGLCKFIASFSSALFWLFGGHKNIKTSFFSESFVLWSPFTTVIDTTEILKVKWECVCRCVAAKPQIGCAISHVEELDFKPENLQVFQKDKTICAKTKPFGSSWCASSVNEASLKAFFYSRWKSQRRRQQQHFHFNWK